MAKARAQAQRAVHGDVAADRAALMSALHGVGDPGSITVALENDIGKLGQLSQFEEQAAARMVEELGVPLHEARATIEHAKQQGVVLTGELNKEQMLILQAMKE